MGAFSSRASLQKHIKHKHITPSFLCHECGQEYPRGSLYNHIFTTFSHWLLREHELNHKKHEELKEDMS